MGEGADPAESAFEGACAWSYLRRDPDYLRAWAAQAAPPRFEDAPFPLRIQDGADLAAAAWELHAWEDPDNGVWRSPFWHAAPMLEGELAVPGRSPLLELLAASKSRLEGLRLLDGSLALKVGRGDLAVQVRVPDAGSFRADAGLVIRIEVGLGFPVSIRRAGDFWSVVGGRPPPQGWVRGANTRNF